jgi:two-component system chemotaxis response regulator CheY
MWLAMLRVLIVNDSSDTRALVRGVQEHGASEVEVYEASSGMDALRMLPRGSFGLVIADLNMPDVNGLELIRFVRQTPQHRDTALLVFSTVSSDRDRERALALGADAFLPEPFSPEGLQDAVAKALEVRGGGAAASEPT